jgi:hypothetical protein
MTEANRGPKPPADDQVATTQLAASSLPAIPGYVVLAITRFGRPYRRLYLSLDHAQKAVARAKTQGRPARLVLCRLEPVSADLDLDGGVT